MARRQQPEPEPETPPRAAEPGPEPEPEPEPETPPDQIADRLEALTESGPPEEAAEAAEAATSPTPPPAGHPPTTSWPPSEHGEPSGHALALHLKLLRETVGALTDSHEQTTRLFGQTIAEARQLIADMTARMELVEQVISRQDETIEHLGLAASALAAMERRLAACVRTLDEVTRRQR